MKELNYKLTLTIQEINFCQDTIPSKLINHLLKIHKFLKLLTKRKLQSKNSLTNRFLKKCNNKITLKISNSK